MPNNNPVVLAHVRDVTHIRKCTRPSPA